VYGIFDLTGEVYALIGYNPEFLRKSYAHFKRAIILSSGQERVFEPGQKVAVSVQARLSVPSYRVDRGINQGSFVPGGGLFNLNSYSWRKGKKNSKVLP
jgi:hypothetical protein